VELISFGTFNFDTSNFKYQEIESGLDEFAAELVAVARASGYFDPNGSRQPPKRGNQLTARLVLVVNDATTVDAELDALKKALFVGRQWLTVRLDDGSTSRLAIAKCIGLSAPRPVEQARAVVPVVLTFQLTEPYWYHSDQDTLSYVVTATPASCDVNNLGTAPLVKAVMRFIGTANRPKFVNNTNGYSIELNQNITSAQTFQIDLGAQNVTLNGADAFASVVLPSAQIELFKFEVGLNDVDFVAAGGGTPNGSIQIIYRLTYH
jgi:hypothetical protein